MAITDVEAKRIVDELGDELGLSPEERLAVRLVAKHETKYSAAWKGEGVGSFNMGAGTTTSSVPGEYFTHGDSRFDPATGKVVSYTTKFAKHPNAKAGFQYLAGQLLFEQGNVRRPRRANVAAALQNRSILELATAMRMNRYYLGVKPLAESIGDYRNALERAYADVKADTGETLFDAPKAQAPTFYQAGASPASASGLPSSDSARSYLHALSRSLPALRRGNRGDLVEVMQFELGLEPDGIFGPVTERRLFEVQREAGLETEVSQEGKPLPLGCCGSKTWALLFADNLSGEDDAEPLERMGDLRPPEQQASLERDWNDDDGNPAA